MGRTLSRRRQLEKYFAYKSELQHLVKKQNFIMPNGCFLIHFYIPMHRTWRKKKLIEMDGRPHQSKPDADNLLKAAFDAIVPKKKRSKGEKGKDDKELWSYTVIKTWCKSEEARIEIVEYDKDDYMSIFNKKAPL